MENRNSLLEPFDESRAAPDALAAFDEIKRDLQIPFLPNIYQVLGHSPAVLRGIWEAQRNICLGSALPQPLVAMILYSIAAASKCDYCGSVHQVSCRAMGVDEGTLSALSSDLGAVTPRRVQSIVQFAIKVAKHPQDLASEDYEALRDEGMTEGEILEVVTLASWATLTDILADALQVTVDEPFRQAQGH